MKPLQNTLYLLTQNSELFWENEAVGVRIAGEEKLRVPAHTIESIVCFGNTAVTTPLIRFCGEHGIALSFLSENGAFYGRVCGPAGGSVLLRQCQFATCGDPVAATRFAAAFLCGKLLNEKNLLLRAARETQDESRQASLRAGAEAIGRMGEQLAGPVGTE